MDSKNNEIASDSHGKALNSRLLFLRGTLEALAPAQRLANRVKIEGVEKQIRALAAEAHG